MAAFGLVLASFGLVLASLGVKVQLDEVSSSLAAMGVVVTLCQVGAHVWAEAVNNVVNTY